VSFMRRKATSLSSAGVDAAGSRGCGVGSRDEIDQKRLKICIIIFYHFLLGNDTETTRSKMIMITKNRYIKNETIESKIC
jgi:hypothetical protein